MTQTAETNWKRLVRDRSDIEELAEDIDELLGRLQAMDEWNGRTDSA